MTSPTSSPEGNGLSVLAILREIRATAHIYTPPSLEGTIVHPGFRGGVLWGGCSFDPKLNRVFVNSDETINRIKLGPCAAGSTLSVRSPERIRLVDPNGYPAIKPPWGYMTAIDMDSGSFAWRVVNGEYAELKARGYSQDGHLFDRRIGRHSGRSGVHRVDL